MAIGLWPSAKSFFAEMKYKPKPKFDSGFMQPDGFGKRRTMVGRMLPQPRVNTLDGEPKLLDELLGSGFALVGVGVPESELCAVIAGNEIARFGPQCVALDPSAVPELAPYRGRILLVRPDRYIAASGTSSGPDSIGVAITSLLARFERP
jgi:3-(3-hydroxy-phenyl)propionate hydroxylase